MIHQIVEIPRSGDGVLKDLPDQAELRRVVARSGNYFGVFTSSSQDCSRRGNSLSCLTIARMQGGQHLESLSDEWWQKLVAIGLVAEDLSPAGIARFAGVHSVKAEEALELAQKAGVIGENGLVDDMTRLRLVSDLPAEDIARINAAVARHLFAAGPDRLRDAVRHARAAGTMVESEEMVQMADHGGRMSLLLGDYRSAFELLSLANDLDMSNNLSEQGQRLCDLALASDGLGDVSTARGFLARAASLGDLAGDASLVARAAVQYALPVDWYAGDTRSSRLLQRADEMDLNSDDRVAVSAARALVEMRVPLSDKDGHQLAWITRPGVAQAIADDAFAASGSCSDDVRVLALIAWRSTHRAPHFLTRRREISNEALNLTQKLRNPSQQVEAAVCLAVDALESGDRPLFDHALAVARWVAERDGNPRLLWRAYCLSAGAALLDQDDDEVDRSRRLAREAGESIGSPGWFGADIVFAGQRAFDSGDIDLIRHFQFSEDHPGIANPIGRASSALAHALEGDLATAERQARRALRQIDPEASYLVLATRMSMVAVLLPAEDLIRGLIDILAPWSDHVAVDSNAWCIDGPVSGWLAELHHAIGDDRAAREFASRALPVARGLNDVRSLRRLDRLQRLISTPAKIDNSIGLTSRECQVLKLLADGATNAQIAQSLAFSVSTIRDDTTSIYRKLNVKGRAEAVGKAIHLNLTAKPV